MDLGLRGRVALVAAATSGLGLATARELAAAGADVAFCGRDEARLEAARKEIDAAGPGRAGPGPGPLGAARPGGRGVRGGHPPTCPSVPGRRRARRAPAPP
ncbi:SDR family NAD(P)-dependent oxidoreductase [Actinomadura geliboluensis]